MSLSVFYYRFSILMINMSNYFPWKFTVRIVELCNLNGPFYTGPEKHSGNQEFILESKKVPHLKVSVVGYIMT